jgi:hypothetical protein
MGYSNWDRAKDRANWGIEYIRRYRPDYDFRDDEISQGKGGHRAGRIDESNRRRPKAWSILVELHKHRGDEGVKKFKEYANRRVGGSAYGENQTGDLEYWFENEDIERDVWEGFNREMEKVDDQECEEANWADMEKDLMSLGSSEAQSLGAYGKYFNLKELLRGGKNVTTMEILERAEKMGAGLPDDVKKLFQEKAVTVANAVQMVRRKYEMRGKEKRRKGRDERSKAVERGYGRDRGHYGGGGGGGGLGLFGISDEAIRKSAKKLGFMR